MKTIFKTILFATALLLTVNVTAQNSPIQFGVKAGVNLSNFGGDVEDSKAKVGFVGGITLDYAFTPDWYLMTGLEFAIKGAKTDYTDDGIKIKETATPMYLQLPVHVGYKLLVAENTKIVFHGGPYIAYGLGGKWKEKANGDEDEWDFFGSEKEGGAKKFDFGLGLGVGVEFGKIGVGLGYDFGLANIGRSYEDEYGKYDFKIRNQNAYLTLGYKF